MLVIESDNGIIESSQNRDNGVAWGTIMINESLPCERTNRILGKR